MGTIKAKPFYIDFITFSFYNFFNQIHIMILDFYKFKFVKCTFQVLILIIFQFISHRLCFLNFDYAKYFCTPIGCIAFLKNSFILAEPNVISKLNLGLLQVSDDLFNIFTNLSSSSRLTSMGFIFILRCTRLLYVET